MPQTQARRWQSDRAYDVVRYLSPARHRVFTYKNGQQKLTVSNLLESVPVPVALRIVACQVRVHHEGVHTSNPAELFVHFQFRIGLHSPRDPHVDAG